MAIFGNKKEEQKKASEKEGVLAAVAPKENTGNAYRILIKPLVSEKSFREQKNGKVVFKVSPKANKISVRKAVEKVYDVKVQDVNIVSMRGKKRNFGRIQGHTPDWKKAIVTLKPGQNIEAGA